MLMAIMGMLIFGALIAVPRWLHVVHYDPVGPAPRSVVRQPARPRWPRLSVREKRNVHARGHSRGKSPHHAGL